MHNKSSAAYFLGVAVEELMKPSAMTCMCNYLPAGGGVDAAAAGLLELCRHVPRYCRVAGHFLSIAVLQSRCIHVSKSEVTYTRCI